MTYSARQLRVLINPCAKQTDLLDRQWFRGRTESALRAARAGCVRAASGRRFAPGGTSAFTWSTGTTRATRTPVGRHGDFIVDVRGGRGSYLPGAFFTSA